MFDYLLELQRFIMKSRYIVQLQWYKLSLFMIISCIKAESANDTVSYVSAQYESNYFSLSVSGTSAPLYVSLQDYPGVIRALKNLQTDIDKVTKAEPLLSLNQNFAAKEIVLVGTLGRNPAIDQLVKEKKLDVSDIAGRWETFLIQVIEKPFPNVERALIIAGSDKRGTIYGIYDLSAKIGVSPWYWWADVPIQRQNNLYVRPGHHTQGEPAVKYRGIFINDEAPALSGWTKEKFGGFNHHFYEKVFELLLRLKANYLWPAMWDNAFNNDDTLNPQLADEYGIVMGTSHHEPMMRSQQEWKRFGSGTWNYETNDSTLKKFWKQGIHNMGPHESIVTIGMRGDGDLPMSAESNITLLEKIVSDQRKILEEVTGKKPESIPQIWTLYKEVQDYYDKGMRVPDDVTLLLCDDNWGNIRKLPNPSEKPRSGGYGIYYHFDYVGGPRNYKWLNTNPIPRVWEQMHLAYQYGVNRIWIVNVGDIKPMEFPINFFLDYAWNPDKWPAERLDEYTRLWTEQQFGAKYAVSIARFISSYTKFNGRRKPELLAPDTYSLVNYLEAETVVNEYNKLAEEAEAIYKILPPEYKNAYYQLVLYPIEACANLNELYVTVGKNRLYAKQGRASTNQMAERAKILFAKDAELSNYYNTIVSDGKWNHMMDQTHIGYTYWQQPPKDSSPEVKTIELPNIAEMGVAIEGSDLWWPNEKIEAILPEFNVYQQQAHYIEIFNQGQMPFNYTIDAKTSLLHFSQKSGRVEKEQRLWVNVDWQKAPSGTLRIPITIHGPNESNIEVYAIIHNSTFPKPDQVKGFVECNGYISIEAEHYTRALETAIIKWTCIPELGRTLSGMTPFPVTAQYQSPGENSPRLEYLIQNTDTGLLKVYAYFSPTLNFTEKKGLRYGISFDNELPQIINVQANSSMQVWAQSVSDNIKIIVSHHKLKTPGEHVLKFWMVDAGLVLQKLVIDFGGLKPSYLGPPESYFKSYK